MFNDDGDGRDVVLADDHSALLVIMVFLGLSWSTFAIVAILYLRFKLFGPFGYGNVAANIGEVRTEIG